MCCYNIVYRVRWSSAASLAKFVAMSRASEHAYARIRERIVTGDIAAGAPLREEQLAEECGVSRTPVREALRRLESELFVVRSETQRSFVADWSREDIDELFTLRGMLEAHAAARAATRLDAVALDRLRATNDAITRVVGESQPDITVFLEENRNFHRQIVDATESPRLASTLARLVEQPVVRRTATRYGREHLMQSAREHDELIQAFAARDREWASAVMTGHIRRAFHVFGSVSRPNDVK